MLLTDDEIVIQSHTTMFPDRFHRALSAFNHSTRRWATIPLRSVLGPPAKFPSRVVSKQKFSVVSWNVDALSSRPVSRCKLILNNILKRPRSPDIIFLQEVTSDVRDSLLSDARVRSDFLATDAEDDASFSDVNFATMALLSNKRFTSDADQQLGGKGIGGS